MRDMQTTPFNDASVEHLKLAVARELRILRGHSKFESPESVGTVANVSPAYIRRIEQEQNLPSIDVLARLCNAYGTTLAKFFTRLEQDDDAKKRA